MALLLNDSVIFIEFKDLICNTDLAVVTKIIEMINEGKTSCDFLQSLIETTKGCDRIEIDKILQSKCNINPLVDYIDYDKMIECNYLQACDDIYDSILTSDKSSVLYSCRLTNLCESLISILRNDKIKHISIYNKTYNERIHEYIQSVFLNNKKVEFVCGDIGAAIRRKRFNVLFLRQTDSVEYLIDFNKSKLKEVLIPATGLNISYDEEDTSAETVKGLPLPIEELKSGQNIDINIIQYPL